ncbi:hypothetical protein H0H81_010289 [Sphagnurus paluster]|uniref:Peroxidase n=1 Tax=Sphagnurus paluster TaxID=117069 RepID=A0A9P7KNT7_9AGAR|nr:hypothetical protein H0H81_010289 [Sphagnurus paluster]
MVSATHSISNSAFSLLLLCILGVSPVASSATFKWPDPRMDLIDETLYGTKQLASFTENCAPGDKSTVAAQWIRLAYHDSSTADVQDQTGGLDASIVFELERVQNVGVKGLDAFKHFTSPYVSMADVIAMGTVLSVASCGGPIIPFRGGRIDATKAGPDTVPEPHGDLEDHIESFKRQGFTKTEMIGLVACGHSLGGVRKVDFPDIIPESGPDFEDFDRTEFKFDNAVVTEFLDDTTANPLVRTFNETNRSDLRIFGSDKNVTMQSLASPDNFSNTCASLFERMINTVPKGVELTDTVDPFENKVSGVSLFPQNGTLVLQATLRRISANPERTVKLFWQERQKQESASFFGNLRGVKEFTDYEFRVEIPLGASVSNFWFTVDEGSGAKTVENGGGRYEIEQDTVVYDPARTTIASAGVDGKVLVVGVRTEQAAGAKVSVETYQGDTPDFIPIIQNVDLQLDTNNPPKDGYTFFTGSISSSASYLHVNAVVGGKNIRQFVDSDDLVL